MIRIAFIIAVALFCFVTAQAPDPRMVDAINALAFNHHHELENASDDSYYCPMDPDIRAGKPGKCRRCGMDLVEGAPDILEYPLDLRVDPQLPRANVPTRLTFDIADPKTHERVDKFEIVHEKLYHIFVVSQDLAFFTHTHPERANDESFHLDVKFPKPGMYRVLSDFYPSGGSPQLITNTVIVPGDGVSLSPAKLQADLKPQQGENASVKLTIPAKHVIAGQVNTLFFDVGPEQGLEQYLGAWGHMLTASSDLIDMSHHHPVASSTGKRLQFDLTFPRPGVYRIWLQFQRLGVVNTVAFNVPVDETT